MTKHLFYTFLFIFIATAFITLLAMVKLVTVEQRYTDILVGSLVVELVGAVIAAFKGIKLSDDDASNAPALTVVTKEKPTTTNQGHIESDYVPLVEPSLPDRMLCNVETFGRSRTLFELYVRKDRWHDFIKSHGHLIDTQTTLNGLEDNKLVEIPNGNFEEARLTGDGRHVARYALENGSLWTPPLS